MRFYPYPGNACEAYRGRVFSPEAGLEQASAKTTATKLQDIVAVILICAAYHGSESLCWIFSTNHHSTSCFRGQDMPHIATIWLFRNFADSSNGSDEVKEVLWLAQHIDTLPIVEFLSDISEDA